MEKTIIIRNYNEADRPQVQNICIATGGVLAERKEMQQLLLTAFCNYYIDREPENCFVAADGDQAIGYILCAADYCTWASVFGADYVNTAQPDAVKEFYKGGMAAPQRFAGEYPAHLHIDILPDYQRMGVGFKLMDALISHLSEKGVPGLMLSVAGDNTKGINFYEKYGFSVLERTPHEIAMGIRIAPRAAHEERF